MDTVHVFVTAGRFRSFAEMRAFVEETYTEDGDGVPSAFMREVGLSGYEPGCIECVHRPDPVPLCELLAEASYSDQWLPRLPAGRLADAAICVFAPNKVTQPEGCSLEYVGAFGYRVVHPEWFERLIRGEPSEVEPGAPADGSRDTGP
jgi:hypothetical protein